LQAADDVLGRIDPHVGQEEPGFQLLQHGIIQLPAREPVHGQAQARAVSELFLEAGEKTPPGRGPGTGICRHGGMLMIPPATRNPSGTPRPPAGEETGGMQRSKPVRGRGVRPGRPGSVRIIGGTWRGRRLAVAGGPALRPTPDRIRETLFNWLAPALPGARCLDLFAGTGVLGLEALSRGAAEAWLVERDPVAAAALRSSVATL